MSSARQQRVLPDMVLAVVLLQAVVIAITQWTSGGPSPEEAEPEPPMPEAWQEWQAVEGIFDREQIERVWFDTLSAAPSRRPQGASP